MVQGFQVARAQGVQAGHGWVKARAGVTRSMFDCSKRWSLCLNGRGLGKLLVCNGPMVSAKMSLEFWQEQREGRGLGPIGTLTVPEGLPWCLRG